MRQIMTAWGVYEKKKIIGSCLVVKTTFRRPCFAHLNVFWFAKLFVSYICISATGNATMSTMSTIHMYHVLNALYNELGNLKHMLSNADRANCARWCYCISKNDVLHFNYRTRVRSLVMLVTHSLTDWLTNWLTAV